MCAIKRNFEESEDAPHQGGADGCALGEQKMKDYQLAGFIEKYLKVRNTTIEPKATQMIADHIGPDLHRLTSELDKVLISLSETTGE